MCHPRDPIAVLALLASAAVPILSPSPAVAQTLVRDIATTPLELDSDPSEGVRIGNLLFFAATDEPHGRELWVTDGTTHGTRLVTDIHPTGDARPAALVAVGGVLYFVADDGVHGYELWRSDGTAAGTRMVVDSAPAPTRRPSSG